MVSFMAIVTLTAHPLWYTVSTRVMWATRPLSTASAGYAGIALTIQFFGAACRRDGAARTQREDGTLAGKPLPEAGDTLAGRSLLRKGSFPFDVVVRRVLVAKVVGP